MELAASPFDKNFVTHRGSLFDADVSEASEMFRNRNKIKNMGTDSIASVGGQEISMVWKGCATQIQYFD